MIQRLEDAELRIAQLQGKVLALKTELNARRKSQTTKSHSKGELLLVFDDVAKFDEADWERLAYIFWGYTSDKEKTRQRV